MTINLTEEMLVDMYEEIYNKIVRELSKKYNKKELLIKIMIERTRIDGNNILEAKELIEEFESRKKVINWNIIQL